jgi:K+-sensing histidine kinase KdpD
VEARDTATAICEEAVRHHADVIVMGESEKGWFRRLLEGSAMQQVVRHAPCPVLVVPHHRPDRDQSPGGGTGSSAAPNTADTSAA